MWQLHRICAHAPYILIGFTDCPHALNTHNQGTHAPFPHYHHVDTVSVLFLIQDLHAITVFLAFNLLELLYSAPGRFTLILAYEGMHVHCEMSSKNCSQKPHSCAKSNSLDPLRMFPSSI
jgi:hypothetical protein